LKKIVVMGSGGFGAEAIWVLEEMNKLESSLDCWDILGYADDNVLRKNKVDYDYETLGTPEEIEKKHAGQELWYFCAIGNNHTRASVVKRLDELGWKAATLIHPSVIMARNIKIGEGSYIGAGSIICPSATIGRHVLINVRVAIGHDAVLANFSQACPGAQINGCCEIRHAAMIGSNASIMPGKWIGEGATVGANSQVLRNVKNGATVNGVPSLIIK
jgi:sugar O-acyltransferase (sialic acid O-acetyltransferase NeuD family)